MELMQANQQWSTRPDDQRFLSLIELQEHMADLRQRSRSKVISNRDVAIAPVAGNHKALVIETSKNQAAVTNWAFGQLAQLAGAPAGYLRSLPTPIVADAMNYGLRYARDVEEMGILVSREDQRDLITLRAATGPNYGRIWNDDICRALVNRFGDGVSGEFRIPGEFGVQGQPITKQNTTIYGSDRDMWVFLADETNRITVDNRRNGRSGSLARGFFVWNSEVGAMSYGVAFFLFDYMCGNHIVWGAQEYKEVKGRHSSGAPHRWLEQVTPAIESFIHAKEGTVGDVIAAAQKKRVDDLDAFLKTRFTNAQSEAIKLAHDADEGRPMASLWDVATGITAYARGVPHMNERVTIEREAGKVLALAA